MTWSITLLRETAVKYFGSQTRLAFELNIKQAAVSQWGDVIPKGRATELHLLTFGELVYDAAHYQKDQTAQSEKVA
tara:strand:+ start:122 stop:349 length:228 start_codon:yes stop_codon:yes gene_type:complete